VPGRDDGGGISGADPDFHRRDLWDAITQGDFPEWEPPGPRPDAGELLRRDRAGGVLHPERGARHRLHQRPAAAGPELLLPGHPAQAAGQPNFTYLPVNAPKCPMAHFQQDGHMAMANPAGRVNYEPNSWDPPGPREDPAAGFRTYPGGEGDQAGPKRRLRAESFADHYSQARQFLISQTETERQPPDRRVRVRAEQVRHGRDPHPDGGRAPQRGRGSGPLRGRRARPARAASGVASGP
jgi:catalase